MPFKIRSQESGGTLHAKTVGSKATQVGQVHLHIQIYPATIFQKEFLGRHRIPTSTARKSKGGGNQFSIHSRPIKGSSNPKSQAKWLPLMEKKKLIIQDSAWSERLKNAIEEEDKGERPENLQTESDGLL